MMVCRVHPFPDHADHVDFLDFVDFLDYADPLDLLLDFIEKSNFSQNRHLLYKYKHKLDSLSN